MKKFTTLVVSLLVLTLGTTQAQIETPQPSPTASFTQTVGLDEITVEYSRPSMKDRAIFGALVPFSEMWRTGANASTKITLNADMTIEGNKVPKGTYAIYTIPAKEMWTIVLHKNITHWGFGGEDYNAEEDLVRFSVKPSATPMKIESLTIAAGNLGMNNADIMIMWENTMVSFKVTSEIDERIVAQIEKTLNPTPSFRDYYSAANYYYDSGKDKTQAMVYINKAVELNAEAFWVIHKKAKMQKEAGDYKGAIATAGLSKEAAVKADYDAYIKMNDELISECKSLM
ncbi:MAG: hypothetical protein ACJAZ3_001392 [Sphingobacteriales bacterium]|jgi:hypothetical protein